MAAAVAPAFVGQVVAVVVPVCLLCRGCWMIGLGVTAAGKVTA